MTLLQLLTNLQSRVNRIESARVVDVIADPSGDVNKNQLPKKIVPILNPAGEFDLTALLACTDKYVGIYGAGCPVEIFCEVQTSVDTVGDAVQAIRVYAEDNASYLAGSKAQNYDLVQAIPKTDKWFGSMQNMVDGGLIDDWAFVNTEQTGLGSDVIGNVILRKNGQAINLDGTPATGDGVISLWEDKDGNTIQIKRS
jgi:hypothetical protein